MIMIFPPINPLIYMISLTTLESGNRSSLVKFLIILLKKQLPCVGLRIPTFARIVMPLHLIPLHHLFPKIASPIVLLILALILAYMAILSLSLVIPLNSSLSVKIIIRSIPATMICRSRPLPHLHMSSSKTSIIM
jgi:hypothetical protein